MTVSDSIARYGIVLERRTMRLMDCIESRGDDNGVVDLSECIHHWAYDVMVSFSCLSQLNSTDAQLVGRNRLWELESLSEYSLLPSFLH